MHKWRAECSLLNPPLLRGPAAFSSIPTCLGKMTVVQGEGILRCGILSVWFPHIVDSQDTFSCYTVLLLMFWLRDWTMNQFKSCLCHEFPQWRSFGLSLPICSIGIIMLAYLSGLLWRCLWNALRIWQRCINASILSCLGAIPFGDKRRGKNWLNSCGAATPLAQMDIHTLWLAFYMQKHELWRWG